MEQLYLPQLPTAKSRTVEEARYVTEMARRLAALVRLQPELDENYRAVCAAAYAWPGGAI